MALASMNTHRCVEAQASAYHIFNLTTEGSGAYELAGAIFSQASEDKECIDKE